MKTIIPRGDDVVRPGDSILIATINKQIVRLEDIFDAYGEASAAYE